ncbi:MAG: HAD family hydrolase [Geminocystis sp.]|nr:HAD family hydrolase [Geminocystis sp.]MDW8114798.1 HAD family hydrolase [Geminocystis sp.]
MNFQGWTLFLDRDGVINKKIEGGYVLNISMFEFIEGSVEAIARLGRVFKRVVVVTNQRGIGRGLMSLRDLEEIHNYMVLQVEKAGGRIDGVFFCPHDYEKEVCNCRKPDIGLALQAKEAFPDIDFKKSFVVGDSASDMEFAKRIGGIGVFTGDRADCSNYDYFYNSLYEFSVTVEEFSRTIIVT